MAVLQGIDDVKALEDRFNLPEGFIDSLINEDDWSLIIKAHALIESATSNMLTLYFGKNELWNIFSRLEMNNKKTGKLAFLSELNLLNNRQRGFISSLSELRNTVVHSVSNVNFSLVDYLKSSDSNRRTQYLKTLNLRLKSISIAGRVVEGDNLILQFPKQVIWSSLIECLSVIWFESTVAVYRNKHINETLSNLRESGPHEIDPRTISIKLQIE